MLFKLNKKQIELKFIENEKKIENDDDVIFIEKLFFIFNRERVSKTLNRNFKINFNNAIFVDFKNKRARAQKKITS